MFNTKNLKRVALLLLVAIMSVAMVACGAPASEGDESEAEEVSLVGSWVLSSFVDAEGTEIPVADYAEQNGVDASVLEVTYEFDAEGNVTVGVAGTEVVATYEFDGETVTMTIEGQTSTSTYDAEADAIVTVDASTGMSSLIKRA